jgi:hypothetical protein
MRDGQHLAAASERSSVAFGPAAARNLRDLGHRPRALESSVMLHFLTGFLAFPIPTGAHSRQKPYRSRAITPSAVKAVGVACTYAVMHCINHTWIKLTKENHGLAYSNQVFVEVDIPLGTSSFRYKSRASPRASSRSFLLRCFPKPVLRVSQTTTRMT